jgi:hypothetical protein
MSATPQHEDGAPRVNPGLIFINREKNQTLEGGMNMQKGGRRPGAGRPKGAISLSTRAIIEAAESGGETPIAYMLRVMRDERIPDARRDRMARAAAAYLHSKLALIEDEKDESEVSDESAQANGPAV